MADLRFLKKLYRNGGKIPWHICLTCRMWYKIDLAHNSLLLKLHVLGSMDHPFADLFAAPTNALMNPH